MDVACSNLCFTQLGFIPALRRMAELEFGKVDLALTPDNPHVTFRDVFDDPGQVMTWIRQGPTLGFAALTARYPAFDATIEGSFELLAKFAKQLAAPFVVIDSAPNSIPFDQEVERLSRLDRAGAPHGAGLVVTTKTGTLTESPETAIKLCEAVPNLGIALDPSHLTVGPNQGRPWDVLYPHVRHVLLRDTGKTLDEFQVKVGRGTIEYGKIITALERCNYRGALVVAIEDLVPDPDLDIPAEVRKLELLLESLL